MNQAPCWSGTHPGAFFFRRFAFARLGAAGREVVGDDAEPVMNPILLIRRANAELGGGAMRGGCGGRAGTRGAATVGKRAVNPA